ncbi:hypothetical protein PF002_g29490 [Phytophthora fragariae]|uniref:Uncharacterized protein n=1 Tax=Phytophthora fragariae TaxID=53985 RepID=A0A6A3VSP7_9STRA|nr:hypothetical protein PF002_g29490 [Phytophthora fragariae]
MLQVAGADILDMPPSGMAASMHALAVSTLPCSTAEWNEGGCVIDTSCLKGHATAALRDWCRTTRGVVCLEWLPYLSLSTLQLYDSNGGQVDVRTALPLLAAPDTIIGDVLNWSHINSDHLAFQALCGGLPVSKISSSRAAQLSRLIALLICNFPSIVYATACHLELRMLSPQQDHPHILTPPSLASPTHALLTTVGSSSSYPLLAFSSPGLLAEAHRATGSTARITGIHPHPTIARLGCLWVGHRRWKRDCKHYKAVAAAVSREKGKVNLQQRALDWALEAPCAHRALERLQWTDIRRIVGISSWGERLLYRIKALGHHGDLQVPASLLQFYLSVVPPGFFTRLDQEFSCGVVNTLTAILTLRRVVFKRLWLCVFAKRIGQ